MSKFKLLQKLLLQTPGKGEKKEKLIPLTISLSPAPNPH